ncbi:MAG: Holliday junction branch migration protein RuvA [Patescibacteria group bacterium]|jgi:Holliday junction DNA helicase RuvA
MIRSLRGTIAGQGLAGSILEVSGVGYLVSVPPRSAGRVGEERQYFTHHHVREDDEALYGFETMEELELFESLLTVPSIGPKLALAILSAATPDQIRSAVDSDNLGFFQSLPGVGKKSAAKIIVELKGKITASRETIIPGGGSELVDALTALGYAPEEIQHVVGKLPAELDGIQAQVTWALRELAR